MHGQLAWQHHALTTHSSPTKLPPAPRPPLTALASDSPSGPVSHSDSLLTAATSPLYPARSARKCDPPCPHTPGKAVMARAIAWLLVTPHAICASRHVTRKLRDALVLGVAPG